MIFKASADSTDLHVSLDIHIRGFLRAISFSRFKTQKVSSRYSRTASIRMFDAIGSVVCRNLEYSTHRRAHRAFAPTHPHHARGHV